MRGFHNLGGGGTNLNMSRVNWGYAWLGMLYLFLGELLRVTEDHKGVSPLPPSLISPLLTSMKSLSLVSTAMASVSSVLAPSVEATGDVDSEEQQ